MSENRSDSNAARLDLMVAKVPARTPESGLPPIVYLAGGPGSPAIATIGFFLDGGPAQWLNQTQELIVIDQRGTGFSTPAMRCDEGEPDSLIGVADCRERLVAEGRDLTGYRTKENAQDIEDLRIALGYEEWDLYGLSYGSDLALHIMRNHPNGLRAVVLDSVYPPQVNSADDEVYATYWAVKQILLGCAAYQPCVLAYPDLEQDLYLAVDKLNQNPISAEALSLPAIFADQLNGASLLELLKFVFAEPFAPALIDAIARQPPDNWAPLISAIATGALQEPDNSAPNLSVPVYTGPEANGAAAMSNSVICAEELPPANPPAFDLSNIDWTDDIVNQLRAINTYYFDLCELWDVPFADASISLPVSSSVPTLILAGTADATTILPNATETQRTLSNSYVMKIPDGEHGVIDHPCAAEVTTAFLRAPLNNPGQACVADTHYVDYEPWLPDLTTPPSTDQVSLYGGLLLIPIDVFDLPDIVNGLNTIADSLSADLAAAQLPFEIVILDNGARYVEADYTDPVVLEIAAMIIDTLEG